MRVQISKIAAILLLGTLLALSATGVAQAQSDTPVVRAVMFYSPTCPHCEQVIEEDLPPLYERYGDQLRIIGVNTLESEGWALYQAAAERFSIPENRRGVPTLIVDDHVLVGGDEINQQFPDIIESGLAAGGIALPDLPELLELLPPESEAEADTNSVTPEQTSLSSMELFKRDPAGNTLAVVVLVGMLASVGYVVVRGRGVFQSRGHQGNNPRNSWRNWLVPVITLIGLAVASYMTYVETQHVAAVCGPVGDCNTVQQSEYARLFGVLPIGLLGVMGYVAILGAWAWQRLDDDRGRSTLATLALFGMAGLGTLFSVYLTFLEPFVIGATCAWCLTSAVTITALLVLTAQPGFRAGQILLTSRRTSTTRGGAKL